MVLCGESDFCWIFENKILELNLNTNCRADSLQYSFLKMKLSRKRLVIAMVKVDPDPVERVRWTSTRRANSDDIDDDSIMRGGVRDGNDEHVFCIPIPHTIFTAAHRNWHCLCVIFCSTQVPLRGEEEDIPLALDDPWWVKLFGYELRHTECVLRVRDCHLCRLSHTRICIAGQSRPCRAVWLSCFMQTLAFGPAPLIHNRSSHHTHINMTTADTKAHAKLSCLHASSSAWDST